MKASIIKKSLVCALTAALVMAPVMGVSATTKSSPAKAVSSAAGTETVQEIATTSSVNGVSSTVSGAFLAKNVNGVALTTPLNDILSGYGIGSGERAYAKVWDFAPKKSYLANAVIENVAASIGAEVGPALQLELGKLDANGKYGLLPQSGPTVNVAVGIPARFVNSGKTYAVVCVREGGSFSILKDLDNNPNTVTFATTAGAGAYAIVRY